MVGRSRLVAVLAAALVAAVALGALAYHSIPGGAREPATATRPALQPVSLVGAGATFPYPQVAAWFRRFGELTGVKVDYQPVGSGAGQSMFIKDRTVDFACSDPPLARSQWEELRGRVLQVPWILGSVAIVYNVPEVPRNYSLRLTGEVIAKIYSGQISSWDDQEIVGLNPELAGVLPGKRIVAVYRSDSSGTTEVLTVFLHKSAPGAWPRERVGKSVDWPVARVGRGVGGKGNEGVTALVLQTPYSIGYVELSYALEYGLPVASVRNAAGRFVLPTDESVRAAAASVSLPRSPLDDFSSTMWDVVYAPGENSYPITSFTYIMLWRDYESRAKAQALSELLRWVASEGYRMMVPGYTAPPREAVDLLLKAAELLAGR